MTYITKQEDDDTIDGRFKTRIIREYCEIGYTSFRFTCSFSSFNEVEIKKHHSEGYIIIEQTYHKIRSEQGYVYDAYDIKLTEIGLLKLELEML